MDLQGYYMALYIICKDRRLFITTAGLLGDQPAPPPISIQLWNMREALAEKGWQERETQEEEERRFGLGCTY